MHLLLLIAQIALAQAWLPDDITPLHYDLTLGYHIDKEKGYPFFGVVKIHVKTVKSTFSIVLHASRYNVSNNDVTLTDSDTSFVISGIGQEENDLLIIEVEREMTRGKNYTLTIPFYGHLQDQLMRGVYVNSYNDSITKQREYSITTTFEPTFARRAFPCFDEPRFKSTFQVELAHQREYNALSNMPIESSSGDNSMESNWPWDTMNEEFQTQQSMFVWEKFAKSPPMPTYLVAFVVSKLVTTRAPSAGRAVRVWTRREAADQTSFSVEMTPKILNFFEEYFKFPLPLQKMDMIAVPGNPMDGVENWGMIVMKEEALLHDPRHAAPQRKMYIATLLAHELSHQWVGCLVTPRRWGQLWLKEGLASVMEIVVMRALLPTWMAHESFVTGKACTVLRLDAQKNPRAVSVAEEPEDISSLYDDITYQKGALLVRMLALFLGEDVFRKALQNYLKKFAYSNADEDDLWREMAASAQEHQALARDITVKEVMEPWVTQPGFPLLTVTRNYGNQSFSVTQERYLSVPDGAVTTNFWWVPLTVLSESDAGSTARGGKSRGGGKDLLWLAADEDTNSPQLFEHPAGRNQWMLLNEEMMALCRVQYDVRNYELLATALRRGHRRLPPLARAQLLDDAFALASSGHLNYTVAFQLASYLPREREYPPWHAALVSLYSIEARLRRSSDYATFQRFIRQLITPLYEFVGGLEADIGPDDILKANLKEIAVKWACRMGVGSYKGSGGKKGAGGGDVEGGCERAAVEMYQAWMATPDPDRDNPIPKDLVYIVCCTAIQHGGAAELQFLNSRRWSSEPQPWQYREALACSRDPWVLQSLLEKEGMFTFVVENPAAFHLAEEFLFSTAAGLNDSSQAVEAGLPVLAAALLDQVASPSELDRLESWLMSHSSLMRSEHSPLVNALAEARGHALWREKHRNTVIQLMEQYSDEWERERPRPCSRAGCRPLVPPMPNIGQSPPQLTKRYRGRKSLGNKLVARNFYICLCIIVLLILF